MKFRVGITRDFLKPDGSLGFGDIGLGLLDENPDVQREFLPESCGEIPPDVADEYDALLVLAPRVTARTVDGCRRLRLIARFGVGYDNVDVEACTRNGVMLSITPEGVRRPVATAALAFLLALSHKLVIKDRLTRAGRWAEKLDHMGTGLTGRTLAAVGLGNIGRELFRLAAPFQMRHVAFDPYIGAESAIDGIEMLDLDRVLTEADFVVICCALTAETRHLLDARRLRLMKPTSYLINVARGPIVDQAALTAALLEGRIAGAGLDVFEVEPVPADDPLLRLDNVIVAPHGIAWTDELFGGNGREACRSILDVAEGGVPRSLVNRQVLEHPALRAKLAKSRP
ncbi:MAG TPA: NAD(P)-dependent oxidoreductase [Pirellulales bacterium]|nr:NAD(P)-dependent oxidoreductase [Pirellulales bacterium]